MPALFEVRSSCAPVCDDLLLPDEGGNQPDDTYVPACVMTSSSLMMGAISPMMVTLIAFAAGLLHVSVLEEKNVNELKERMGTTAASMTRGNR